VTSAPATAQRRPLRRRKNSRRRRPCSRRETGNPAGSIDHWHVHNAGSDYMVDCLKHVGYDY